LKVRIGIDFDNTLAIYDRMFAHLAWKQLHLVEALEWNKQQIRDYVRCQHGDLAWQKLQAQAYGPGMQQAEMADGALQFLGRCGAGGVEVKIISHKTVYSPHDPTRTNLREQALIWMADHLFGHSLVAVTEADVLFSDTRAEKIDLIRANACEIYIDDLREVLLDSEFPTGCKRILYSKNSCADSAITHWGDWKSIHDHVFGD
jgi:hypothetical protein